MTREKAQDEILVRLDEIQQILDHLDPERECFEFHAAIERGKRFTHLAFVLRSIVDPEDCLLDYDEEAPRME